MLQTTMEKQVRQALHTVRTAIERCPEPLWRAGKGEYLVIARLAFHLLQAIDYHLDAHPDQFDWNAHGIDWEGSAPDALWDQARTLAYLDEIQAKAYAYVADEAGLLSEDVSPRFFVSRLGRCLLRDHLCYVLRHTAQHTGEINSLLRQAGAPVGSWL
ncbi:MAG: hypothetical protein ACK2VA_00735 [Anaerolineae bacterium]|jgi:uncharacterized damage-inducible protein DinB